MTSQAHLLAALFMALVTNVDGKRKWNMRDVTDGTGIEWQEIRQQDYNDVKRAIKRCTSGKKKPRSIIYGIEGNLIGTIRTAANYESVGGKSCFIFGQDMDDGYCRFTDTICGITRNKTSWGNIRPKWPGLLDDLRHKAKGKGKDKPKKILNGKKATLMTGDNIYEVRLINYVSDGNHLCNMYADTTPWASTVFITCAPRLNKY